MTLASLQLDALRTPAETGRRAVALAEARGFNVLGRGSTRVGIEGPDETVVKVAHNLDGLWLNLQEMALWVGAALDVRRHLAPCVDLTSELILIQRRVDVIGPPLTRDWRDLTATQVATEVERTLRGREEAFRLYADRIYACRDELGFWSDPDPARLRLDNFGLLDGRIVLIDFGDQFPPLPSLWAQLLDVDDGERVTYRDLAERAGLTADNRPASPRLCEDDSYMDHKVADVLAELTVPERTAA